MSIFSSLLDEFGDRLEELIAQVASEKMEVKLEDIAADHIPDVVTRKVAEAFEELDLPALILDRVQALDLQKIVRNEVQRIVAKLLQEQLGEMIRKQVRAVLGSDALRTEITDLIGPQARTTMASKEIAARLEALAREGMTNTLQRWTKTLTQSGDRSGDGTSP